MRLSSWVAASFWPPDRRQEGASDHRGTLKSQLWAFIQPKVGIGLALIQVFVCLFVVFLSSQEQKPTSGSLCGKGDLFGWILEYVTGFSEELSTSVQQGEDQHSSGTSLRVLIGLSSRAQLLNRFSSQRFPESESPLTILYSPQRDSHFPNLY